MLFLFSVTWGSVSGWWSLLCLAAGVLYAWLMYRQPVNISDRFRIILSVLRGLAVTLIALLLVAPLIKTVNYDPQKPLILIAQDNSSSLTKFEPAGFDLKQYTQQLVGLKNQLGTDYDVREYHFNKDLEPGLTDKYNGKQTNIAAALHELNEQFVNQNIGAVILATDGIYNQGADPQYEVQNIKSAIYTVALGDTTQRRDVLISNINYNRTTFLGNDFEIELLAEAYMSKGENMHLTIAEDGKQVYTQNTSIESNSWHKTIPLKLNADKKGLHKFTVSISPLKNESSVENNTETIYVEVIDGRQKVLLIYNSPHPDIGVIKQAIETNRNYELKSVAVDDLAKVKLSDYNLLVLHQVSLGSHEQLLKFITSGKTPLWFMAGAQSNLADFNQQQQVIKLVTSRQDIQEVFAVQTADFSGFTLTDSTRSKISAFPPLLVPYGSYSASPTSSVLFKQKIGSIETNYPLLAFATEQNRRTAILAGEGLWRWSLSEFQSYGNHHVVEELVSQIVQYLTANSNKQRFRVYTGKNIFDESEHVIINAELYNEALELINNPDVKLELKNQAGKSYSYLFSRSNQSYQLDAGILSAGDYTYTATTQLGKQRFTASGQLSIKALDAEARQSKANHQLLRIMARQTGGAIVMPSDIEKLADLIRKNDNVKTTINEDKRYRDLIDIKWVFVLIAALLSTEWFLRKREGEI